MLVDANNLCSKLAFDTDSTLDVLIIIVGDVSVFAVVLVGF